jgi:hypothetical protein
MSEAKGTERSLEGLARRLLFVNFASIHTSALVRRQYFLVCKVGPNLRTIQVLAQILCRLVSNPEYIEPLRQEVEAVIAEEGWTKAGIDKMRKLDSFLREIQRTEGIAISLSDPLHNGLLADICSSSVYAPSRTAPFHIFQRRDSPGGYTHSGAIQCDSYG